jgi:hypothetical protein
MKSLRYIVFFVLPLMGGTISYAQQSTDLVNAYNCVGRKDVDSAKFYIDRAIAKDSSVRKDAQYWYVRGFVYKELYKKYESSAKLSTYRDTSLSSFLKSVKIDSSAENKKSNYSTIKYLAGTYYNDAGSMMDSLHYTKAKDYFKKYKSAMTLIEPSTSLSAFEISFNLKLGEVYSYLFFRATADKQKKAFLDSAKMAYNVVLGINPNDVSANYNLAILYYNQAVYIINQTNYDDDIAKLNAAQDTSIHLAMQSLPFMQKTYQLDPKKKDAIKGLEGIYYLLHDTQKFEEYENKLKDLEGGK